MREIALPEEEITNLEFSMDGRMLLLYGPKFIGLIDIPEATVLKEGSLENASLKVIDLLPDRRGWWP